MTRISDGQPTGASLKPNESAQNAKFQEKLRLAEHNSTRHTRSVTPAAIQRNGVSSFNGSNLNAPSTPVATLRRKLDVMLGEPGGDTQLQRYMKGEIPADQAKSSLAELQTTFNDFVRGSVVKEPGALSKFYTDYKEKFSSIIGAANTIISDGADQVKYQLSTLAGVASDHANRFISDDEFRGGVLRSAIKPKGLNFNPLDNSVTRLVKVAGQDNITRMNENIAPENRMLSESEAASVSLRFAKTLSGTADTKIRVYRYPDGNAQIEFYSHLKGSGGRGVEWNVGNSETFKGKESKVPPISKTPSDDVTYAFAEWIASAGAEGSFNSKVIIKSKDGVSGWDRAQSFLNKTKTEQGGSRFLPWNFIPALEKEFDSEKSGGTGTLGGAVTTKVYGSSSILNTDENKIPEKARPLAAMAFRAYGEATGGAGIKGVYNYNNPDVAVADEHTDTQNVQAGEYIGFNIKGELGAKGAVFLADTPLIGLGASVRGSYSRGWTQDARVETVEAEVRMYVPDSFYDGRVNRGQIPKPAQSTQFALERGKEESTIVREREITGYLGQNARDVALNVNKREYRDKPLLERLDLIKDKLPEGVDLDKAKLNLMTVTGRLISDEHWENFLEKQLDGNSNNNIRRVGKFSIGKTIVFQSNIDSWTQKINDWRERNNIDQLERSYQLNWPKTRDNLIAQGQAKIEKMDMAATSEYLRSKFVLTPGTTGYTILDGSLRLEQYSLGHSVPNKKNEKKWSKGLYKGVLYAERQQHDRLGAFEIDTRTRSMVMDKILGSDDRKLSNAFLDIYNSQSYPTIDKNGERMRLRPLFSGDSRHIKRIIDQTGAQPNYGNSVYIVKPDDINSGDRANNVVGRMITNGISQMSDGKETLETMYPNDRVRAAKLHQMVREFKEVNFPGASDKQIMERLEPGVPLMLMDFSRL